MMMATNEKDTANSQMGQGAQTGMTDRVRHQISPITDNCTICGASRIEIEDNLVGECTGPKRQLVNDAWTLLRDAAITEWDEWSKATPENERYRAVAERLSGLPAEQLNELCIGYRGQSLALVGRNGPISMHRGPFQPAWTHWLNDAHLAIQAVTP
jgi:hypothetical protein